MGAGLILDIIVGFLWRSIARAILWVWSVAWKRDSGIVTTVSVRPAYALGCPLVTVQYRRAITEVGNAVSKVPFLFQTSAENFAREFQPEDKITIRVNQKDISKSLFFASDHS